MPIINSAGAPIYYEVKGHGSPLVLIPGFASGIWSWKYQIEQFATAYRVLAFDPPGIGRSQLAEERNVSIGTIADDVVGLLDELEIGRASVLGISFGGFVAQDLAFRYPERIDKLILACTSYGGPGHVPPSADVLAAFASTKMLNSKERIHQYLTMAFTPEFVDASPEVVEDFCILREQNTVPEGVYMDQLLSATTFDAAETVRGIEARTLVISGTNDTVVPVQNSINLAAAMPNATLETIDGGSHMFFVENYERFNSVVMRFLKEGQ